MYTSGTTGDPKGVLISNNSIVTLIAGVKRLLESVNEAVLFIFLLVISNSFKRKARDGAGVS